jgi:hypothetical protein
LATSRHAPINGSVAGGTPTLRRSLRSTILWSRCRAAM